ncbi:hypothetical protein BH23ACT9_BH23ACT9_26440 [soil metagenome]
MMVSPPRTRGAAIDRPSALLAAAVVLLIALASPPVAGSAATPVEGTEVWGGELGATAVGGTAHGRTADVEVPGVQRLAGQDRAATAAVVALDGWSAAETVVIVDGWDYVAALTGAHLAARLDVPVLISGPQLPDPTADAVRTLGATDLMVIGRAEVPDDLVEGQVTRITHADAAGLAAAVVQAVPGAPDLPLLLVSQDVFADALAAANLAPARILVTDPEALSPAAAWPSATSSTARSLRRSRGRPRRASPATSARCRRLSDRR